jgi:peptide/nickel transport system permease protein
MLYYVFRRILMILPVLFGITLIIFALLYVLPGDPVRMMVGNNADPETVERIRHEMGLDRPFLNQYADYAVRLLKGDFGRSYQTRRSVLEELEAVAPRTIQLSLAAEFFSIIIGIGLGLLAAVFRNKLIDRFITTLAALQLSFPLFWLALMVQLLVAVQLKWLPSSGYGVGFDKYILLPAFTMAIPSSGILARMTRVAVVDVLREDYIRTANAKGMRTRTIYLRHALPNALIPIVTTIGLDLARLIGGITMIEVIFTWPGLGKYAYDALVFKDLPALSGSVIVFALLVSGINLAIDLVYGFIDPRISRTA